MTKLFHFKRYFFIAVVRTYPFLDASTTRSGRVYAGLDSAKYDSTQRHGGLAVQAGSYQSRFAAGHE